MPCQGSGRVAVKELIAVDELHQQTTITRMYTKGYGFDLNYGNFILVPSQGSGGVVVKELNQKIP